MEIPACSANPALRIPPILPLVFGPFPPEFVYNLENNRRLYPLQPYIP
jgi:hypothetical protein